MSLKVPKTLRTTAAWRISLWPTLAFAVGTALTFSIVYLLVARGIRARSDAWLKGEAEVLSQVSADTPRDHLYNRIVGEVAELASREVPDERNSRGQELNSVFFLEEDSATGGSPLWVGPSSSPPFLKAIHNTRLALGVPESLQVEGWPTTFRVVAHNQDGRRIYLGLSNRGIVHALNVMAFRFLLLWGATVLIGFFISYISAYRTLLRVERITETVGRIGTRDLAERLPEPVNADEISRLASTFNRMLERIQTSVTELRTVTDAVAHDLRSPVTSIRCSLESALSNDSNEGWRDSICEAIEGLDRLLHFLNTTLDVAEAEGGALRLERTTVDLSAVVKQLVNLYVPSMAVHRHELALNLENHVMVEADEQMLHRMVSNLLENELTHLPPERWIGIRLFTHDGAAELKIEDNGPGFSPEVISRAFERFAKGKHSSGHGLGLAFVQAVVRAQGGSARIAQRTGGGAVVTVLLPEKRVTGLAVGQRGGDGRVGKDSLATREVS